MNWLSSNTTAVFSIISLVIGYILSHLLSRSRLKDERKWRLYDSLINFRIDSHKKLLKFSQQMSLATTFFYRGKINNCIYFFIDHEKYKNWNNTFIEFIGENFLWFSKDIITNVLELNTFLFDISDYLAKYHKTPINPKYLKVVYCHVGSFLIQDFRKISKILILKISDFYNGDITDFGITNELPLLIEDDNSKEYRLSIFGGLDFYNKRHELDSYISTIVE